MKKHLLRVIIGASIYAAILISVPTFAMAADFGIVDEDQSNCDEKSAVIDQYCGQHDVKPDLHLDAEKSSWKSYSDYQSGILTVVYIIENSEGSDANIIRIISPTGTSSNAELITALPLHVGSIAQGESDTFKLQYHLQSGVTSFYATVHATAMTDDGNTLRYPSEVKIGD